MQARAPQVPVDDGPLLLLRDEAAARDGAARVRRQLGVQGALAESMTVWINALVASGGGKILENPDAKPDEMQLGLDSDAGRKAAEIIGRIGSSNLCNRSMALDSECDLVVESRGEQRIAQR